METRHVEVERFARKASGYKKALELAPEARAIELRAVVAMVLGACRRKGWRPEETTVVDLMAGSGALSMALRAAGFTGIKAVEACAEMIPDGVPGVEFVDGQAFKNIRSTLIHLRPQVIVSLAGFHHLIERSGKGVDRLRSVTAQATLAGACVDALVPGGVLLVVDIAEDEEFGLLRIDAVNDWDARAFESLKCGGADLRTQLMATLNIGEYEAALKARFGDLSMDGTLEWFRQFVDSETAVGHDDVAISGALLQLLRWKYGDALRFMRFRCPWVFETEAQATNFVLQKFGFYVDRPASEVQPRVVLEGMKKFLGFRGSDDKQWVLGWSLAAWMVNAPTSKSAQSLAPTMTVLLLIFSAIMFARTVVKVTMGLGTDPDTVLSTVMWLVIGCVGGMLLDDLKAKLSAP